MIPVPISCWLLSTTVTFRPTIPSPPTPRLSRLPHDVDRPLEPSPRSFGPSKQNEWRMGLSLFSRSPCALRIRQYRLGSANQLQTYWMLTRSCASSASSPWRFKPCNSDNDDNSVPESSLPLLNLKTPRSPAWVLTDGGLMTAITSPSSRKCLRGALGPHIIKGKRILRN